MKERIGKMTISTKVAVILAVALFLSLLLNAHLDLLYAQNYRLFMIGKDRGIQSVVAEIGNMNRLLTKVTSRKKISSVQKRELMAEMKTYQESMLTLNEFYHVKTNGGNLAALQNFFGKYTSFILKTSEGGKLSNQDLLTFKTWKNIGGNEPEK